MTRFHTLHLFAMLTMMLLHTNTTYAAKVTNAGINSSGFPVIVGYGSPRPYGTPPRLTLAPNTSVVFKITLEKHFTETGPYKVHVDSSHPDIIADFDVTNTESTLQCSDTQASCSFQRQIQIGNVEEPTAFRLHFDAGFVLAGHSNQPGGISLWVVPPPPSDPPYERLDSIPIVDGQREHSFNTNIAFDMPSRAIDVRCTITGPGIPEGGARGQLPSARPNGALTPIRNECSFNLSYAFPLGSPLVHCAYYAYKAVACNPRGCTSLNAPGNPSQGFRYNITGETCPADFTSQGAQQGSRPGLGNLHKNPKPGPVDQNILVPQSKKYGNQPPQRNYPLYDPKTQNALPKKR